MGKILTSVVRFLDATQHTNVILIDVPLRYDPGKRPHINEEIVNYNRKLHKVTKSLKHAKLIKSSTNRELFTQRRLHLNKRGKEIMSNEIIEKLLIIVDSQKVDVIHLPWKIESVKQSANGQSDSSTQINIRAVTPIKKNGKIKQIPSSDICMEGSKETSGSSSEKGIGTKMVLCTRYTSRRQ
jgi:hypothetical protein